jgi:putative membrane protein
MRYLYLTVIVVLVGLVMIFAVQNGAGVTISFLAMSATLPLALLVLLAYSLGVVTGGSVLVLLRSLVHGASRKP